MRSGKAFLTTSCTASLEMAALILNIQPGDEIILPSYTYVATVNAFILRGAIPVFVDIEYDTMNMDVTCMKAAITPKTRAIVPVHYAGVACDMDSIMSIAHENGLFVIEDAAQGISATYKGSALGTIGDIGCLSFHETKNVTSGGQGGATLVNRDSLVPRAEIVHDGGSDRARFRRGEIAHYEWRDVGSNFLLSEIQAALLWAQFEAMEAIQRRRHEIWDTYQEHLKPLAAAGFLVLPSIPSDCSHNAHIFAMKVDDKQKRIDFMQHMKQAGVATAPHYSPLHSTPAGLSAGRFCGQDINTSKASAQLVRLPLYTSMTENDLTSTLNAVTTFWQQELVGVPN